MCNEKNKNKINQKLKFDAIHFGLLTISANAEMTLPSVVKLLLMLAPSLSRVPLAPVESARSLPAKSTKLIFDTFSEHKSVSSSCFCCVKNIVNTACERELVSFMFVAATVLEGNGNRFSIEGININCKLLLTHLCILPSSIKS